MSLIMGEQYGIHHLDLCRWPVDFALEEEIKAIECRFQNLKLMKALCRMY
jgi:hypothetical protein